VLVLLTAVGTSLSAKDRSYCHRSVTETTAKGGGSVRIRGFTVEVKPAPDPDDSDSTICQASVRSPQGKTIFEFQEWGLEINPVTGKDVNGDGSPDAVFNAFSGGAHCCWTYFIVSLGKNPGLLAKFENNSTASFNSLTQDGKIQILIRDGTFDEAFGLGHPFSPFPPLIVRLNGSQFEDVGPQFWSIYKNEIQQARAKLKSSDLDQFLHSSPTAIHHDANYLATETHILQVALNYLYAGRPKESRAIVNALWPLASQNDTWAQILNGYCKGLRAGLQLKSSSVCANQ
jgi:hypothetical protein